MIRALARRILAHFLRRPRVVYEDPSVTWEWFQEQRGRAVDA